MSQTDVRRYASMENLAVVSEPQVTSNEKKDQ